MLILNNVKLKALRKEKNISTDILAEKAGTTKNVIAQYECGMKQPSISMLKRIADFLNCSMDDLMIDIEPHNSNSSPGKPNTA